MTSILGNVNWARVGLSVFWGEVFISFVAFLATAGALVASGCRDEIITAGGYSPPADTGRECEGPDSPSSLLMEESEDGRLDLAFAPRDNCLVSWSTLWGTALAPDGTLIFEDAALVVNWEDGLINWTTSGLPEGSTLRFYVEYGDGVSTGYSCEPSKSPPMQGYVKAKYGVEELMIGLAEGVDNPYYCRFEVDLPPRPDPPAIDTGVDGEGGEDTESGSDSNPEDGPYDLPDDGLIEICYAPGGRMYAGELFLDGPAFYAWDTSPADAAEPGDRLMCALVEAEPGDELKMNAWWQEDPSDEAHWAAFNDWCLAIEWQGTLLVEGAEVMPDVEPWSAEAWAEDPCAIGGDAYFLVP